MMPVAEGSTTRRKVLIAALVIGVMALILQIVGFATPGWLIMDYSTFNKDYSFLIRLTLGLWYDQVKICFNTTCQTMSIDAFLRDYGFPAGMTEFRVETIIRLIAISAGRVSVDMTEYRVETIIGLIAISAGRVSVDMTEYRVETIIGLIAILAAIISVQFLVCHPISVFKRVVLGIACLASALSCILALAATGRFGSQTVSAHNGLGRFSLFLVPYSIIITGVGGILAAILYVLVLIGTCNMNNREVPNQQGQTVAMATYSQDARHYTVPSHISGYPQHAGATRPHVEQNSKWQGNLVVSKGFPSGNHLVTKFHH